jgi:hypothetical protein
MASTWLSTAGQENVVLERLVVITSIYVIGEIGGQLLEHTGDLRRWARDFHGSVS